MMKYKKYIDPSLSTQVLIINSKDKTIGIKEDNVTTYFAVNLDDIDSMVTELLKMRQNNEY